MRPLPAIIDGQRTVVTGFYQDHHKKDWYIRAYAYLEERRTFIQKRFIECMRYVDVHSENTGAFSYEFASILRDDYGERFQAVTSKATLTKRNYPRGLQRRYHW